MWKQWFKWVFCLGHRNPVVCQLGMATFGTPVSCVAIVVYLTVLGTEIEVWPPATTCIFHTSRKRRKGRSSMLVWFAASWATHFLLTRRKCYGQGSWSVCGLCSGRPCAYLVVFQGIRGECTLWHIVSHLSILTTLRWALRQYRVGPWASPPVGSPPQAELWRVNLESGFGDSGEQRRDSGKVLITWPLLISWFLLKFHKL